MEDKVIDIKIKNFRLTQICNIVDGIMPISYGLALEKTNDYSSYFVIAFIRGDEDENIFESVGVRFLQLSSEEYEIAKKLATIAIDIVCLSRDNS